LCFLLFLPLLLLFFLSKLFLKRVSLHANKNVFLFQHVIFLSMLFDQKYDY
jgi:hypothetical protein